jgi:hypothetical protein
LAVRDGWFFHWDGFRFKIGHFSSKNLIIYKVYQKELIAQIADHKD